MSKTIAEEMPQVVVEAEQIVSDAYQAIQWEQAMAIPRSERKTRR